MIDVEATRDRLRSKGLTIPGWARSHGLDPAKLPSRFHGNRKTKFTQAELDALRSDGLLVEKVA